MPTDSEQLHQHACIHVQLYIHTYTYMQGGSAWLTPPLGGINSSLKERERETYTYMQATHMHRCRKRAYMHGLYGQSGKPSEDCQPPLIALFLGQCAVNTASYLPGLNPTVFHFLLLVITNSYVSFCPQVFIKSQIKVDS